MHSRTTPVRPAPRADLRRFSRGDGVELPDGSTGVISSASQDLNGVEYLIEPSSGTGLVFANQEGLVSRPELNTGKYGGPSRGGAAGGWVGGNNYRPRQR